MPEIDHTAIKKSLMEMKETIHKMYMFVENHEAGKGNLAGSELVYTTEQKAWMITQYTALKAQLETEYGNLPSG